MKHRYNIALIPISQREGFIQYAKGFSAISDRYLLGAQSFPHVTLCQFHAEEAALPDIWARVLKSVAPRKLTLVFPELHASLSSKAFWIMLVPDQLDTLKRMHHEVADIIKHPLNRSYEDYFPHLSLINSLDESYLEVTKKAKVSFKPMCDEFVLSLGKSDEIGQYTEVIYY